MIRQLMTDLNDHPQIEDDLVQWKKESDKLWIKMKSFFVKAFKRHNQATHGCHQANNTMIKTNKILTP